MEQEVIKIDNGEFNPIDVRKNILDFEAYIGKIEGAEFGDNDKCPLKHSFAEGIYCREIFIPKGMLLIGKIHKHSHPVFIMKGDISIVSEEGIRRIKAPAYVISPAGVKRVGYAHEDTVWVTVHDNVTNETDLGKLEDAIIAKSYNELECEVKPCLS
jgi:hypothetical protein